jgi:ribosomal protein S18 acetylase RimI-like enzyme
MPANSEQSLPTGTVDPTPVTTEPAPEQPQTTETEQATDSAKPARRRHVWRCAPSTMIAAVAFMVITAIVIPGAAVWAVQSGFTAFGDQPMVVLNVLGVLAVLCLVYGWRMVLHPRIKIKNDEVIVHNPFRSHRIHLDDITQFRPGGDGLVVATSESATEAWCVQKSTGAIKANQRRRADEVCDELWAYWDDYHRPDVGAEDSVKIRFARPGEANLLMQIERSASAARLGHIFPPEEFPYPEDDIQRRWQANLDDPHRLTMVAVVDGEPAGYACFGDHTLYHLGVSGDHQRKGIGSTLLEAAEDELFADVSTPQIQLWVLEENQVARTFYRERGWQDTGESRNAEFPPHPVEVKMVRRNPHLARRGR